MNDLKQLRKEVAVTKKRFDRSRTFFALLAAHNFEMACINSSLAKHPTTLEQAKNTAGLVNLLYNENKSPFEFIKPTDELANKSIEYFNAYKTGLDHYTCGKQSIESFAKYYANTGWAISKWKCNINYILYIGIAIQQRNIGSISEKQLFESIDSVVNSCSKFFSYKPKRILRSFAEASRKLQEIETKIDTRNLSSNNISI